MVRSDAWRQFKTTRDVYCSLSERFTPAKWHPHILLCLSVCSGPEGRKKAGFLFLLATPVTALLGVCEAGNLPSPTDPFAEVSLVLRYCIPKKGSQSGTALWKGPLWRGADMQWGAIVPRLPRGRVDGNVIFKKWYKKITAFYSSDLFRPKLQAREILFFQASWFVSDYRSCSTDACLNTSHACGMKDWSSLISPASWARKGSEGLKEAHSSSAPLFLLPCIPSSSFRKKVRDRECIYLCPHLPFKHRKVQWEQIVLSYLYQLLLGLGGEIGCC